MNKQAAEYLNLYYLFPIWSKRRLELAINPVMAAICEGVRSKPCEDFVLDKCGFKHSFQLEFRFELVSEEKAYCQMFEECDYCYPGSPVEHKVVVYDKRFWGHPVCVCLSFCIHKRCRIGHAFLYQLDLDKRSGANRIRYTQRLVKAIDEALDKKNTKLQYISEASAIPYYTITGWRNRRESKVYEAHLCCKVENNFAFMDKLSTCVVKEKIRDRNHMFVFRHSEKIKGYCLQNIYSVYEWNTIAYVASWVLPEADVIASMQAKGDIKGCFGKYRGAKISDVRLANIAFDYVSCCPSLDPKIWSLVIMRAYKELIEGKNENDYMPELTRVLPKHCWEPEGNGNKITTTTNFDKPPDFVTSAVQTIAKQMSKSELTKKQMLARAITVNEQVKFVHIKNDDPKKLFYVDYFDYIKYDDYTSFGNYGAEVVALAQEAREGLFDYNYEPKTGIN